MSGEADCQWAPLVDSFPSSSGPMRPTLRTDKGEQPPLPRGYLGEMYGGLEALGDTLPRVYPEGDSKLTFLGDGNLEGTAMPQIKDGGRRVCYGVGMGSDRMSVQRTKTEKMLEGIPDNLPGWACTTGSARKSLTA
jgi:hypothetical protein